MDPSTLLQFRNCNILRDHKIITEDIWVRNGKIVNPEKVFFDEKIRPDVKIDCKGALISPGFIDLQLNGGFGVDFSCCVEDAEASVRKVAKGILSHGVTSFCPTVVTSPPDVYKKILPQLKKEAGGPHGATILGVHLEGPFISTSKKGAHPEQYILNPEKGFQTVLDTYGHIDDVSIVTVAPELPNALEVIRQFVSRGTTISVGHSIANLCEGEEAVRNGASFITHLFNAMLPFHHRDPGLVGLLASDAIPPGRNIYYGIICDMIHTHPAAVRIAYRTNPEGLVLVTDAMSALGLQEGTHQLGQMLVDVKGRVALVAGTETLCGSISSMIECVRIFKEAVMCSTVEALEAATLHPAQTLGIKNKGTLDYGADADFVFLGPDLDVWSTWIAGEAVYLDEAAVRPNIIQCKY